MTKLLKVSPQSNSKKIKTKPPIPQKDDVPIMGLKS